MQLKDGQVRLSLPKSFDAGEVLDRAGLDRKLTPYVEFMVGNIGNWRRIHRVKANAFLAHDVGTFRAGVPKDLVAKLTRAVVPAVLEWKDGGRYRFGAESGNSCRSYRFAEAYQDQPLRTRVLHSYSVWGRLRKHDRQRELETAEAVAAMPEFHHRLHEMEKQFTVSDQLPAAHSHPITSHMSDSEWARHRWYIVDEYGRIHHPLVACPKAVRPWLTLKGSTSSLSQCDVSGSQIILAFMWVMGLLQEGEGEAIADRGKAGGKRRGGERDAGILSGYSRRDFNDILQMFESLITGEFSWKLFEETNRVLAADGQEGWTMGQVKKGRLSAVFGHWRTFMDKPVGRALKRMCPAFVEQWMKRVRAMPPGELARKMQAIESGIMLHGAAARLMAERPECKFGTMHDAIVAEDRHIAMAVEIIKAEWELAVGIAPPVKCQSLACAQ